MSADDIDTSLVQAAREGDKAATQRLFERLLPRARNLARYLVRGDRDVDDMSQQALLQIWRGLSGYRGDGSFQAYADRIVARTVFATLRQLPPESVELDSEQVSEGVSGEADVAVSYLQRRELVRALDLLPAEQRAALVMHRILGWSIQETAEETGVSIETVRSRMRLGLQRLQKSLAPRGESSESGELEVPEAVG